MIDASPMRRVQGPRLPQQALEPVSMDTLRAMRATCDKTWAGIRDLAAMLCLLDSGARAEFVALDVDDVNLSTGAVIVKRGKGGKWRTCCLPRG